MQKCCCLPTAEVPTNLVCLDRRRVGFTAEMWLTHQAAFLLFAWRRSRGAVGDFFLKFCRYVVTIILARNSCSLTLKDARFWIRITLRIVLIHSLVCAMCVPGSLRSGSGVACFGRFKQIIKLAYGVENEALCLPKLLGQLLCYSTLNFSTNLSDIVLYWSESVWVLCQVARKLFLTILLVGSCNFLLNPQNCHILWEK